MKKTNTPRVTDGQMLHIRVSRELHKQLKSEANRLNISMNHHINNILTASKETGQNV